MSINDVEDQELVLTQKNDPDNCQSKLHVQVMGGCEDICIEIYGMTSDTREWSGHCIFLDAERINLLYRLLGDHLATLNVGKTDV